MNESDTPDSFTASDGPPAAAHPRRTAGRGPRRDGWLDGRV